MLDPVTIALRYQATLLVMRDRAAATATAVWDQHGGIDDQALAAFTAGVVPVITASQTAAAQLTNVYIGNYVGAATGDPPTSPPVNLDELVAGLRAGAAPSDVYTRPVVEARSMLSRGGRLVDALAAARARVTQTASTDVMLAARASATESMVRESRIVGYRRVADGRACPLCLTASTQRYHSGDLMPIHPHCGCSVAPIIGSRDPGQVLNKGLRDRLATADPDLATRDDPSKLYHELAVVHEHGELGPVLYRAGDHFAGDLAA